MDGVRRGWQYLKFSTQHELPEQKIKTRCDVRVCVHAVPNKICRVKNAPDYEFQSFKVSKFQDFKVSKLQTFKVPNFQFVKLPKFQTFKASKFQDLKFQI